jgi:ketosteroid isomerase-like protein
MAGPLDWETRLRAAIDAYNRGDYEAVMDLASEDIELQRAGNAPESREVVRGREAVLEFFRPEVFEDQRIELGELEVGSDAIVAAQSFTARGRGSGLPIDIDSWVVYRIGGDVLTRIEVYNDEAEARAAARL